MRLLRCLLGGDFVLTSFDDDQLPPYAILSHTWIKNQEVSYNELNAGTGRDKTGFDKIRFCGEQAAADGLYYFWVDTCCIDKSESTELSTAINSMFRWYKGASRCYVYLPDVSVPKTVSVPKEDSSAAAFRITWADAFRRSRWFTRGWTLQELIAPTNVEFFSKERKRLGTKVSLAQEIHEITKIPIEVLRGQDHTTLRLSVEEQMSWAAQRTTTLREDKVYCLLGIFGVYLPLIYGEGEAYATLRLNEEIQKRRKGQGLKDLHNLSVSPQLPFARNECFIGRDDQLEFLEQALLSPTTHQRVTVYGLGGCGKSALAIEFAYRTIVRNSRHLVFWVPAISQESFELAYREIGIRLCIPGITDDNVDVKKLVNRTLSAGSLGDWLMIVDNADDPAVLLRTTTPDTVPARLVDYLPHSNRGAILFTTRSRKAEGELTPSSVLELDDMSKAEAEQLLAQHVTKQVLLSDKIAVDDLLKLLTYLPLAIVQAAAFMSKNSVSASYYLSLFQQAGTEIELFSERFEDVSRYHNLDSTIAKTWHISFDQIRRQDPLAAEYLSLIACFDRINIPQSLLASRESLVQQVKALGTLIGYAFITERQQTVQGQNRERFFDMHRLVHMASVWWLDGHGERATWAVAAVTRLEELVPYGGHEKMEVWTMYLSHAMHAAGLDDIVKEADRASLLDRVGRCQTSLGQYSVAEATNLQALLLRKEELGPEHPDTLMSMSNLAGVLNGQGKYDEAEAMNRQTLALREKVLGSEHPHTLMSMSNLAGVLDRQCKYEEAEALNRQTLARREKVLGSEHLHTLMTRSNLALVLDSQAKYKEAEAMNRQTLALREKVLGSEHPDTLMSMSNLAGVLNDQGKYNEAETINRQTLVRREKVLGSEHPDTLMSMSNLARVLDRQGKYEEAEAMYRHTLARREKVLGSEHPDTLMSMSNLALVLMMDRQDNYEEAESMSRRTLALREKVLGFEHIDTLMSMSNLAGVLDKQGKYKAAEAMNRQVLVLREKVLGSEHPDTLMSMSNLALVLMLDSQDNYEEAEALNRQTLAQREQVLESEHSDTLMSMNNLAGVLARQCKYEEAEVMHRQTLELREKVLGNEHPDTLNSVYALARVLTHQDRYYESGTLYERACAAYSSVLGDNHPTTRACRQHYSDMRSSQKQFLDTTARDVHEGDARVDDSDARMNGSNVRMNDSGTKTNTGKASKLSRGLAKMGIKDSKFFSR